MEQNRSYQPTTYRITVKETIEPHFADWLGDLVLTSSANGETILMCEFADQPALRGFLNQVWNLNLTVLSVERIKNES